MPRDSMNPTFNGCPIGGRNYEISIEYKLYCIMTIDQSYRRKLKIRGGPGTAELNKIIRVLPFD